MKALFSKKLSCVVVSLLLLISVACKAENPAFESLRLSKEERDEIIKYSDVPYAYLGSELSDIIKLVRQISDLYDNNKEQKICELCDHVNAGCKIGRCDEVVVVLTEALVTLDDDIKSEKLAEQLKDNIERLQSSELTIEVIQRDVRVRNDQEKEDNEINMQLQAQGLPITIEEGGVTRGPAVEKIEGCLEVTNDAFIERNLTVKNDLLVKDDATIRGDLVVKDKLEIRDKAKFKKNVEFKKSVEIDDDLKVKNKLTVSGKAKFKKDTEFKKDVEIDSDLLLAQNNLSDRNQF